MNNLLHKRRWEVFKERNNRLLVEGLNNGKINLYDEELIKKLRTVYYGGVPASIVLLSNYLCNGYCYDRALLLAEALIDEDIRLVYASVDSLKLNPKYMSKDKMYADHCFLERTTNDGKELVYDTSTGFIYDKDYYYEMEHPEIRRINDRKSIIDYLIIEKERHPEDIESSKIFLPITIPCIEASYGTLYEMYSHFPLQLLQREMELFKNEVGYEQLKEQFKLVFEKK